MQARAGTWDHDSRGQPCADCAGGGCYPRRWESLCAQTVVSGASSFGSDQNGKYYIAVEPWPWSAAMALLSVSEGACRQAEVCTVGGMYSEQRDAIRHAAITWSRQACVVSGA